MRPAHRLRLAGALAATGEIVLGALLTGTVLAPYFWVTAAATVAVTLVAGRFMEPPPRPPDPPADAGEPEPPWWPDFERDLRAHLRRTPSRSG